jgi:hypothetical protein
MSIDAMKQALEALEYIENNYMSLPAPAIKAIAALRLAIEQAERQQPVLVNIELSRRMAAVKVSNFYGSIIRDAEKEIERLHGLVLQHTAPPQRQPLTDETMLEILVGIDAETKRLPPGMKAFARAIEHAHGIGGGE